MPGSPIAQGLTAARWPRLFGAGRPAPGEATVKPSWVIDPGDATLLKQLGTYPGCAPF
jgi:hypothetical protein